MATNREKSLLNRIFDGRYLILRKLGSGGMAEVYLAEDQELGRKVALKMLDDRHARDEQFVERFKREARNAAGLSHPNIVQIYDRGQAEGTYYIAMEYLDGPTLKELLVRKGPTPPQTAIKFAREILSALAEAHRHQIVHRDIKPHNVIVGPDWQVKVTDFGIARSGASQTQMTEVGAIVGTAQYLSPEQARGAPVDPRSDIYSLGIVLYEMLTGTVPFSGEVAVEIAMKHLNAVPLPPSTLRPEIPHALDAVVMRALSKEPAERYASAEEMDADLARVAAGKPPSFETEAALTQILGGSGLTSAATVVRNPPPPPPPLDGAPTGGYGPEPLPVPLPPPRRRRMWPAVLWLVALAILAAGGYLVYRGVSAAVRGSGTVAVPDVMLTNVSGAEEILKGEGLVPKVVFRPSSTVLRNDVSSESPPVGQVVKKHQVVTLIVSSGKPTVFVPSLVGEQLSAAESALSAAQLTARIYNYHSSKPAGTVTAQLPKSGTRLTVGSSVRINVSSGPLTIKVPYVVGDTYSKAVAALQADGFAASEQQLNNPATAGQVFAQNPAADTAEPKGTTIALSVSKGPATVPVPSVLTTTEQDAATTLYGQGFTVNVVDQQVADPTQNDEVLVQSPKPGTRVAAGSTVTITVGEFESPSSTQTNTATTSTTTSTSTTATTTTATTPGSTSTTATTTTATTPGSTSTTATTPATTSTTAPPGPTPPGSTP